ncbi:hypothetical protein [Kitasatospora sp. NPDC001132]
MDNLIEYGEKIGPLEEGCRVAWQALEAVVELHRFGDPQVQA